MATSFIDDDLVVVHTTAGKSSRTDLTIAFGDEVEVLDDPTAPDGWRRVRVVNWEDGQFKGFIRARTVLRDEPIVRFSMVDVQQGDGMVLETPSGKIVLIDGGESQLFARHVAARFRHRAPTSENPLPVEAIVITHGDQDHFDGLNDFRRSETLTGRKMRKRIPIQPKRILTNGLVKGSSEALADKDLLGATTTIDGMRYSTDLYDDPRDAAPTAMSAPFKSFKETLDLWSGRGDIEFKRVDASMDPADLFDFLVAEGFDVELLGPFVDTVPAPDGTTRPALRWFPAPGDAPEVHLGTSPRDRAPSASHTINGHSIGLRITFGTVRLVLTGDMNKASMEMLRERLPLDRLEGEFVKAPHHGSHEFDLRALKATRPVVAAISSGDESTKAEYIHPRATLVAALGQSMRQDTGIVFSTELAAFFAYRNECFTRAGLQEYFSDRATTSFTGAELAAMFSGVVKDGEPQPFYGFERTNFGIIHLRTDGERVLVFTHSGKHGLNEAYRFRMSISPTGEHQATFEQLVKS